MDKKVDSEGGASKMLGCQVVGAGCSGMNGWYALDGEYAGRPRYKHTAENLYIRYGGRMFEGYGISPGREPVPGHWAYFCRDSHKHQDANDVPHLGQWETHGGFGAEDPAPYVLVVHNISSGNCSGNNADMEDNDSEHQYHNTYCVVSGAGCSRMNGMYFADGRYQGKPRYRHAGEKDLYLRIGGRKFWGYGITMGREAVPGGWAYFCETSHDNHNMSDVPDLAMWCTHGNFGATDPPPVVELRQLEKLAPTPKRSAEADVKDVKDVWAIAGDLLWDGTQEVAQTGLCVMIQGDCIHSVCSIEEAQRLNVPVEQHEGCCLMPGLIDAHVHMEFSEDYPLHEQPRLSSEQLLESMAERARRMVCSGITAARDLGGRNFAAVALREEIRSGRVQGPRLICAGQPLTSPGGHCHQWGGEVSNVAEAKAAVRRQHQNGADWLKVMATGGMRTPGTNVEAAQFSKEGLQEIIAEASACGLPVAAHAHGTAGVIAAVAAGCKTVEHCTWIANGQWGSVDEGTLLEMARRGVCVAPTAHANWSRRPMGDRNYHRMSAALQRLRHAGVPLLASSDAGAIRGLPHDALAGGIEVLAAMAKMSPVEALQAATSVCAKAIGLGEVCGRLAPGFSADLLLVSGDPTQDLRALWRPQLVVAAGRPAKPDVEPPPQPPDAFVAIRKTASSRLKNYATATLGALKGQKTV